METNYLANGNQSDWIETLARRAEAAESVVTAPAGTNAAPCNSLVRF